MTADLAAVFGASFVFIFLKATQQKNVMGNHYKMVIPTSLLMAFTEVYVIAQIVNYGWTAPLVLSVGFGAGCGAMSAMYVHTKFLGKKCR